MIRLLFRALTRILFASTLVAFALGRLVPETQPTRSRDGAPMAVVGVELRGLDREPMLLDAETGRLTPLERPALSRLARAGISPWQDDRGQRQVVGLEWTITGQGSSQALNDVRIVRFDHPGGATLDRVPLAGASAPSGPPCWPPGTSAWVLYAGWDGRLYRLDFERCDPGGGLEPVPEPVARPVPWGVPGPSPMMVADLNWPGGPRLGGRVLAALSWPPAGRWELWWLKLDTSGRVVESAARLTRPDPAGSAADPETRFPLAFVGPEGSPMLAYLEADPGDQFHRLRVAPLRHDPSTGAPYIESAEARTLAEGCLPASPIASADGWWLSVLRRSSEGPVVRRVPLSPPMPLARR